MLVMLAAEIECNMSVNFYKLESIFENVKKLLCTFTIPSILKLSKGLFIWRCGELTRLGRLARLVEMIFITRSYGIFSVQPKSS